MYFIVSLAQAKKARSIYAFSLCPYYSNYQYALYKKFSLWLGIKIVLVCWFNLTIFVPSHKEKGQQSKKENQKQYVNQKSKEEN